MPIRAAVLEMPGQPLKISTLLLDDPQHGEVRVRTLATGLCHSDLHYLQGALAIATPVVLGHEVTGIVEAVGAGVRRVQTGDRVVVTVTPSCGACKWCVSGVPTQCERVAQMRTREAPPLTDLDGHPVDTLGNIGGFAEAMVLPEAMLAVVSETMPSMHACLLGCCISTGFGAVMHGARVGPSDTVAVIGCGGVGMAAVQASRLAGARRVVAIDIHAEKLALAMRLGATDTIDSTAGGVLEAIADIVPGGISRSFEAVGRPETAELAFAMLSPRGVATILGLMRHDSRISVDASALIEGDRTIQGAYMGSNRFLADIPMLSDHAHAGRLDLAAMVTSTTTLDDINHGFAAMADPTAIRTVVDFTRTGASA